MAGQWLPFGARTFKWDTTATTYKGSPVVMSTSADDTVTNPAGTNADVIIGVAAEDAGPSAYGIAATQKVIAVTLFGVVPMFAKGSITRGAMVKIGPTITLTPIGAPQAETLYTAQSLTKASAGNQPYPALGVAMNNTSQDGDIVYVLLQPGAMF